MRMKARAVAEMTVTAASRILAGQQGLLVVRDRDGHGVHVTVAGLPGDEGRELALVRRAGGDEVADRVRAAVLLELRVARVIQVAQQVVAQGHDAEALGNEVLDGDGEGHVAARLLQPGHRRRSW